MAGDQLIEAALTELLRIEVPGHRRDMHSKFRHGGKAVAIDAEGAKRTIPAHELFARIEKLAKALDALEQVVQTKDALEEDADEMVASVRRMRGSFTTFNFLLADREDYFTGKG